MRNGSLTDSAAKFGLLHCDRCGSCSAVCPMREFYPDFSRRFAPRSIIARLRLRNAVSPVDLAELLDDKGLWMCLACEACLNVCPQGVEFRDFVEHLRTAAIELGLSDRFAKCDCCNRPYLPREVIEALGRHLPDEESSELLKTCPKCRRRAYGRRVKHAIPGASRG